MRHSLGACALVLMVLSGCVSALREPVELARPDRSSEAEATDQIEGLVAEAKAAFARRPDASAVARAHELFVEAARLDSERVEGLLGATRVIAWQVEHSDERGRRRELVAEAVNLAQLCRERAPQNVECRYRLALALGQQARERPATAKDGLERMVELLEHVAETNPELDHAGAHRVLALVLLRAPHWPAGPGDPEWGLEHAQAAVKLAPGYTPNLLALAEAQLDNDLEKDAASTLATVRDAIDHGDPDAADWLLQLADLEDR